MSYEADLYAQLHRGTPGDVAFYLDAARGAGEVLELGCGYGRILTELARAGHRVTGLDIEPGMLALAAAARDAMPPGQATLITIERGDMRAFDLDRRFDRVIVPFNGLYCMLSEAAVVDCLRCAARHLNPGGKLLFDAYAIDDFHTHTDPREFNASNDNDAPIESLYWRDAVYDVYESCFWDKAAQRLEVNYCHVPRDGGKLHNGSLTHRYLLTSQLPGICRRARLRPLHLCQDFAGTPLAAHAKHMTLVAEQL